MMSWLTCCLFNSRRRVYSSHYPEIELDNYTYFYLDLNIWTAAKISPRLYIDYPGLMDITVKTINLLIKAYQLKPDQIPHHLQSIMDESNTKTFTTEQEALNHANACQQGLVLCVKNFDNDAINAQGIIWAKSYDQSSIELPPKAVISPLTAMFNSRQYQARLTVLLQDINYAAADYLRKYPYTIIKTFYGSHTHQTAAKKLIGIVDQLKQNNSLENYLAFLVNYRKVYQSLARGELSKSLQKTNALICQSLRDLLKEPISDWALTHSFEQYIKKIHDQNQLAPINELARSY